MRAKAEIETYGHDRERIIVTEIPYQVNKANMIERTAELVNDKKLEGISDIRDESDRDGMRIVYEIKRDANAGVVLNNLYKYTALQTSFSINSIALVKGRPMMLNLKDLIHHFVDHRHEVIVRRTKFELDEAEKRAHILQGLLIALDHLDEVIALIRASKTPEEAREGLMEKFGLSELQARAILEMRLRVLTGLERDKIKAEYEELMALIEKLQNILNDETLRMQMIKDELVDIRERFGDDRRSEIVYAGGEFRMEDMIENEEVVITVSNAGYIKRTALSEYRVQGRGGKGSMGSNSREEDFIEHLFIASTHNYILFFTELGRCHWLKVYEIPEGTRTSKGRAIQNLVNISKEDRVRSVINVNNLTDEEYLKNNYIIMCTKNGTIKKTLLDAYSNPRVTGINAININEGDQLLNVLLTNGTSEIVMALRSGRAIRFNESTVRPMGRTATGVRGITLAGPKDEVIGMIAVNDPETTILVVSEKGYGKRTDIEDYRVTNRGGKGVKTIQITDKTGDLIGIKDVVDADHLMIINKSGLTIRMEVKDLRVMGRATQGVRLIKLNDEDEIASIAKIEDVKEEDLPEIEGAEALEGKSTEDLGNDSENTDNQEDNTSNLEE
jgi:DNA gyrase subunit A